MSAFLRRIGAALAALVLLPSLAAAQDSGRLDLQAVRVLADGAQTVKGTDGTPVTLRATLTYDPSTGLYARTVTDASGAVLLSETFDEDMIQPTPDEEAAAQALIAQDPELSALVARSADPVTVSGGFPLAREAGHACGPGSRCMQYDLFSVAPGSRRGTRIRYVVIDLRDVTFVSRDFDAATEGNLANPAIRAESRSR